MFDPLRRSRECDIGLDWVEVCQHCLVTVAFIVIGDVLGVDDFAVVLESGQKIVNSVIFEGHDLAHCVVSDGSRVIGIN